VGFFLATSLFCLYSLFLPSQPPLGRGRMRSSLPAVCSSQKVCLSSWCMWCCVGDDLQDDARKEPTSPARIVAGDIGRRKARVAGRYGQRPGAHTRATRWEMPAIHAPDAEMVPTATPSHRRRRPNEAAAGTERQQGQSGPHHRKRRGKGRTLRPPDKGMRIRIWRVRSRSLVVGDRRWT